MKRKLWGQAANGGILSAPVVHHLTTRHTLKWKGSLRVLQRDQVRRGRAKNRHFRDVYFLMAAKRRNVRNIDVVERLYPYLAVHCADILLYRIPALP